jgi:hypothetical protein
MEGNPETAMISDVRIAVNPLASPFSQTTGIRTPNVVFEMLI